MKQLQVNKTKRIARSKNGNLMLRNVIALALFMLALNQTEAQEKIFSIDAFTTEVPAVQGRMMAARTLSSGGGLNAGQITAFRNLYYNAQPTVYYNADGVNDASRGASPIVIVISDVSMTLEGSSHDFSDVRLLVIDGLVSGVLSPSLTDKFPALEFLVFKHNAEPIPLNEGTTGNLIPNSFWEASPDAVVIYNNLKAAQ